MVRDGNNTQYVHIELRDPSIMKFGVAAIIEFYQTMAVAQHQFGDIFAFVTGVISTSLNVAIDTRIDRRNSAALIQPVTDFFDQHQVPWGWFITPAAKNDLIDHGFSLDEEAPAMYFDLQAALPKVDSRHITIEELTPANDLLSWIDPIYDGFGASDGEDTYRKLNADIFNSGLGKLRHFVAYIDNVVVGASTLFITKNAVMIHNLATKISFTRRGVGTALTLYMMEQARQSGIRHCFLDSSTDGFGLYRKIGFKIYSTTLIYASCSAQSPINFERYDL
jgi:ribosomal protein S18 acetylase RimI-like enzyme